MFNAFFLNCFYGECSSRGCILFFVFQSSYFQDCEGNIMGRVISLRSLPEELLIKILQVCSGKDILNFAEAFQNQEVNKLISDKALWRRPTIGPNNLREYLLYLGPHTTELTILGFVKVKWRKTMIVKPRKKDWDKTEQLSDSVIARLRQSCPNLVTLNLTNCVIDPVKLKFSLFPLTMRNLKLSHVVLVNLPQVRPPLTTSPLSYIQKALPQLENLFLESPWYITPYDRLETISRFKLEYLWPV